MHILHQFAQKHSGELSCGSRERLSHVPLLTCGTLVPRRLTSQVTCLADTTEETPITPSLFYIQSRMELLPDVWKQDYWLPPGVTWTDMDQLARSDRPLPLDLLIALPLALAFVAVRYIFER